MSDNIPKELREAYEKVISYLCHLMPIPKMEIDSVIAEDTMVYGTTIDENIFGIDHLKRVMKMQAEQMQDLQVNFERNSVFQHYSDDSKTGIFVEELTLTVNTGETVTEDLLRVSFVMEKMDGSWKLIHAHGSRPVESEEDPWHVKEWETEKEKLEKQVAEQTADLQEKNRELEIEAASERVRAEAMSMQEPDDIFNVLQVVKNEIDQFELGNIGTWMWTLNDHQRVTHWEITDPSLLGHKSHTMEFDAQQNALTKKFLGQMENEFFTLSFKDESLLKYLKEVQELDSNATDSDAAKAFTEAIETGKIKTIRHMCATFSTGLIGLMFATDPPVQTQQVLTRITEAFGLAYQRFLDLQNAEERRKEAELEAALERVRAHAMGMQEPDDIMNVLNVMKKEILNFGLGNIATWIWINNNDGTITQWDISEFIPAGINANFNFNFDPSKYDQINRHGQFQNTQEPYYTIKWEGQGLQSLIDQVTDIDPESGKIFQDTVDNEHISEYWQAASPFSKGILGLDFTQEPKNDTALLLSKMADAFGMAYQRFEDLQKAEAQTREAQIELSLERIRAQATGMQKSTDLLDIVVSMRKEFLELGNEAHYFWHMKWLPDSYEKAMTSGDGNKIGMVMTLPRHIHGDVELVAEWEKGDEPTLVFPMDSETAVEYVDKMISLGDFEQIDPNAPSLDDIRAIGGLTFIMARTTHGEIGYSLPGKITEPPEKGINILKRFAGAFDLAYRRFEDLLQSEQQAYESKVEASLERVRGMAAAMNHSDDLMQIAEEMFREMEILKINPLRYGLGMIEDNKTEAELWASTVNDGHYLDLLGNISLTWHPMLQKALDAWDAQHEELVYKLEGQERADYYERVTKINPQIPDSDKLTDPDSGVEEYCSFLPFKSGILYAFTKGMPSEEGLSILKRFANVFEQAFTRFQDLQKTEKQARLIREERDRLEQTLVELHATQDQLVQQEKLASLGQLTAGIAHEIKNPLNFVNNFSDLSIELVDEIREELNTLNDPENEHVQEIHFILNDIQGNLKKIYEHGTRADSIVKSMLQHSRGGTGSMEPTDVNVLLKEFVNLAFHGMRAGKNAISVDIQFDLNEKLEEVPLIAEDFSRVILNICNNAFDALREKLKVKSEKGEEFKPELTIRTTQEKNSLIIEIEDNGPGIPDEMKEKVLQPFFTTKKGTAGTGLGLSITNDIVKAHGGKIDLRSVEGEKTQFIIHITR